MKGLGLKIQKGKRRFKEYQRNRRNKFPGKRRARDKLGRAISSGKIERRKCEVCGETKTQAHHLDYRKPLEIIWLCFKHHRQKHGQMKEIK